MTNGERAKDIRYEIEHDDDLPMFDGRVRPYEIQDWRDAVDKRITLALDEAEARGRGTILCVNDTNEPVALSYAAQAWGNHQIPAGKALAIVEVKP